MDGAAAAVVGLALIAAAAAVYFLPAIIAGQRRAAHQGGIFALTLFLGWTVIGWLAALIWALGDDRSEDPNRKHCQFCDESISAKAVVCPHCRRDIPQAIEPEIAVVDASISTIPEVGRVRAAFETALPILVVVAVGVAAAGYIHWHNENSIPSVETAAPANPG